MHLAGGAATSFAAAPERTAKLAYSRGPGALDCPDSDVIRAGVAARLGYEPFDDRAPRFVTATVNRTGPILQALIQIAGAAGEATAERKLTSRESNCVELASAIELAISIAIDPVAAGRAPARPAAPPPDPPPPALAPPPAPPTVIVVHEPPPDRPKPVSPSTPIGFQVRLGGLGALGSAPATALGATLQASVRRGAFSIGLEGRGDFAASSELRVGSMQTSLLMGSLIPCAQRGVLEGCVLLSAGVLRASGRDLVDARQVSAPLLAVGARVGLEIPLGAVLSAGLHLDVLAPITEVVLRVSGEPVWNSPPISGTLGLTVGVRFL